MLLTLLIFSCATTIERVEKENQNRIGKMFSNFEKEFSFSGSVLIYYNNKVIINKSYGFADEDFGIKNISETKFMLGSYTKQFTSAAILLLDEEGELSLDDGLNLYLPNFPAGNSIKIKHLLNHTSGLPREADYRNLINKIDKIYFESFIIPAIDNEELANNFKDKYQLKDDLYILKRNITDSDVFETAYFLFSLGFDFHDKTKSITEGVLQTVNNIKIRRIHPGVNYKYSNLGYMILGLIIEKASGMKYEDFIKTKIFEPLNMTHSGFNYDPVNANGFALALYKNNLGKSMKISRSVNGYLWPGAAGIIYSTVSDINKWLNGINFILKDTTIEKMYGGYVDSGVLDSKYGYGYFINNRRIKGNNRLSVWHDGRIYNYRSLVSVFPDDNLRVIILANKLEDNSIYYWPYIIADILFSITEGDE